MSDPRYPYDGEEEVPPSFSPDFQFPGLETSIVLPPPPPPPPPPSAPVKQVGNQNKEMQLATTSDSSSHPIFASSSDSQDVYKNTTSSGFKVAGQQKDGALVEASEFRASTVMKEDGVQHNMYAGWKNQGEAGVNSRDLKWFEKRDGKKS